MNEVQVFQHEAFGSIRTVMIEGEPWFVGKDVAAILGYSGAAKAIRTHVDDEDKGVTILDTPGGKQSVVIINESGLYSLILSSKLPGAKAFKHGQLEWAPLAIIFGGLLFSLTAPLYIWSII